MAVVNNRLGMTRGRRFDTLRLRSGQALKSCSSQSARAGRSRLHRWSFRGRGRPRHTICYSYPQMSRTLDPVLRRALTARIRYYNDMGIYDFYRRPVSVRTEDVGAPIVVDEQEIALSINPESREEMSPRKATAFAVPVAIKARRNASVAASVALAAPVATRPRVTCDNIFATAQLSPA